MAFLEDMNELLQSVGLSGEVVSSSAENAEFGNSDAIFAVGKLLLHLIRDRGQIFLEIAACTTPRQFHQFDDVEVAMGSKTMEEVLSREEPEKIDYVLKRVKQCRAQLESVLASNQGLFVKKRIERIAKMRGVAFSEKLRMIAMNNPSSKTD